MMKLALFDEIGVFFVSFQERPAFLAHEGTCCSSLENIPLQYGQVWCMIFWCSSNFCLDLCLKEHFSQWYSAVRRL